MVRTCFGSLYWWLFHTVLIFVRLYTYTSSNDNDDIVFIVCHFYLSDDRLRKNKKKYFKPLKHRWLQVYEKCRES